MYRREPIQGREKISRHFNIDRRTFTKLATQGAVADDAPSVSGQYVIPGLTRDGRHYVLEPTFRLPDTKAPIHAAMPRLAHYCLIYMDGEVFGTPHEVVQGRSPYVPLCEPPGCMSGQNRYAVLPLDQKMQPLPDWPSPVTPDTPVT